LAIDRRQPPDPGNNPLELTTNAVTDFSSLLRFMEI
jgi:hypothetical protein